MMPFSITVEPITLLYVTAINCEYTLIQYSVSTSHCLSLTNLTDPTICESPKSANVSALIKDDVTISMRYYNLVLSLCCSLATLFTGSWSDYYGRRLPMKFALISSMLAQILCIIFWITLDRNWIWFIYAAGLVSGISGSSSSLIANCFGYTADITSVEARSKAMATMEAMLYLGNAIGFTTGSLVLKTFGSQLAIGFSILFLIHTSLFIYVLFYLRESKSSTDKITLKGLFRLSHVATVFRTLAKPRSQPYKKFWLLTIIGCAFIATLGSNAMTSIIYVFLRNAPLHWTSEFYGYLQASNYTLGGCTLLILVPLTQRFFPRLVNDDLFALLGFISRSTGLVVLGLARTDLHAFLSPLGFILSELTLPSIRSSLSKIVEDDEKGKAFAFLGLLSNFTFLIGSQISSFIYYRTSSRFPGLVFIILGIMELIPATIFFIKYKFFNKAFTGKKQADSNSNLSSRSSQDRQDSRINSKDEVDHSDIDVTLTTGLDKLSHASLRAKTKEKESESKRTEC